MLSVFADSSVLIAGAGSKRGASRAVLVMAEIGLFRLIVSQQVLDECERNLRKELPQALPILAEILASIDLEIVSDPPAEGLAVWESIIAPKDAPIFAAAHRAKADRLLTLDRGDFAPDVATASGLVIMTPGEFVQQIRTIIDEEGR
jgi:predicted nucleic acid-binding protein